MSRSEDARLRSLAMRNESLGLGTNGRAALHVRRDEEVPIPPPQKDAGVSRVQGVLWIPLGRIVPDPNQPRRTFDAAELEALAVSMKARGQLEPCRVVVTKPPDEEYRLIFGERRHRAAILAGLPRLACMVVEDIEAIEREADQAAENLSREDLSTPDLARVVKRQIEARGCSQRELAARLGTSQAKISEAVTYAGLVPAVKAEVDRGRLSPSAATEIAKLPRKEQSAAAKEAARGELTRDQVREKVKERREVIGGRSSPIETVDHKAVTETVIRRESKKSPDPEPEIQGRFVSCDDGAGVTFYDPHDVMPTLDRMIEISDAVGRILRAARRDGRPIQ